MGDVISSIGIGIGTAAADSIGYWPPARYRSNPTKNNQTKHYVHPKHKR